MKCSVCEATIPNDTDVCPHCAAVLPPTRVSDHLDRIGDRVTQTMDQAVEAARTVPRDVAEELDAMTRAMRRHARSATDRAEAAWDVAKHRAVQEAGRSGRVARDLGSKSKALPQKVMRAGRRAESKAQRVVRRVTRKGSDGGSSSAK
jgi:hypothetical protein